MGAKRKTMAAALGLMASVALAVVILVSARRWRADTAEARCRELMRLMMHSMVMYESENGGFLPPTLDTLFPLRDVPEPKARYLGQPACPGCNKPYTYAPAPTVEVPTQDRPYTSFVAWCPVAAHGGRRVFLMRDCSTHVLTDDQVDWAQQRLK